MSNEFKNIETTASEKIYKVLGKKLAVHSWVMSEITEENPDWHEKDEKLSLQLVGLFLELTSRMNKNNVRFMIADRSGEETEPHYAIDIQLGDNDFKKTESTNFFVEYLSKIEGEDHSGDMKATANFDGTKEEHAILIKTLFEAYCRLLEQYYPEFDTSFKNDNNGEYVDYKNLTGGSSKTR